MNCSCVPAFAVGDSGDIATLAAARIVTVVDEDFAGFACDTAVTVTVSGLGTPAGAV